MHLTHPALLLLALTGAALAAPLPFDAAKWADPVSHFVSRLASRGKAEIPELSAHVSVRSVRGETFHGLVIRIYDKTGKLRWTIRAEQGELQYFQQMEPTGGSRPVVSIRLGPFESIDAAGLTTQATMGGSYDLPWPPAPKK